MWGESWYNTHTTVLCSSPSRRTSEEACASRLFTNLLDAHSLCLSKKRGLIDRKIYEAPGLSIVEKQYFVSCSSSRCGLQQRQNGWQRLSSTELIAAENAESLLFGVAPLRGICAVAHLSLRCNIYTVHLSSCGKIADRQTIVGGTASNSIGTMVYVVEQHETVSR